MDGRAAKSSACQCGCQTRLGRQRAALAFDCGFDSVAHRERWQRVLAECREEDAAADFRRRELAAEALETRFLLALEHGAHLTMDELYDAIPAPWMQIERELKRLRRLGLVSAECVGRGTKLGHGTRYYRSAQVVPFQAAS